ncbi:MAG: hypothetical protein GY757_61585 [bacterium]|nr:hypothetical protein [bacterium]
MNRVLCYKENGLIELEMACSNFHCLCKHTNTCNDEEQEHDHLHSQQSRHQHADPDGCEHLSTQEHKHAAVKQISPRSDSCLDKPFESSWLDRVLNPESEDTVLKKVHNYNINSLVCLNEPFDRFFDSLPLSKFLNRLTGAPETGCVVFLC